MARPATGSVRKLSARKWEVRVANASRVVYSRAEAERTRRQMLADHEDRDAPLEDAPAFRAFLDDWLRTLTVAPKTAYNYRWVLSLRAVDSRSHLSVDRITHRVVDDMISEVHSDHGGSSARALYRVLTTAFGWGIRSGRCGSLAANPMDRVAPPKARRNEPVVPSQASILAALDVAEPEFAALIRMAIATSARRSELAALQWRDVNYDARTVIFRRAIDTAPGPLAIKQTKSDRSRTVAIDDVTIDILRAHADAQIATPDDGWIWSRHHDGQIPIRPDRINVLWRRVREAVPDLGNMRFHDLRHTAITWLIMSGADPRTVAARAGHSSPNITLAIYTAHVAAADRAAATTMERLLTPPT